MAATFTIPEILAATGGALMHRGGWDTFCRGHHRFPHLPDRGALHPAEGRAPRRPRFHPQGPGTGAPGESWWKIAAAHGEPCPASVPPEVTVIAVRRHPHGPGGPGPGLARPLPGAGGGPHRQLRQDHHQGDDRPGAVPAFRVLKNELNLNNLIGLPQTLLELDGAHEAAVVEMGMNRFGEIRRLTRDRRPHRGGATNVYPAHTEGVGDVAGVARAKGELIGALDRGAILIYNADDPWVARQARDFRGP